MSFAVPLLLAGLAAISVPIILHLMSREVPKTIHFPTLRFIKQDKLETQSRRGIRDLLLLLLRCLIIAAIVFAFAKPFLPETPKVETVNDYQTIVILDNSLSMNRPEILAQIKTKLQEKISPKESVALLLSNQGVAAKFPFENLSTFWQNLEKTQPSLLEGNHEIAFNEALSLFHPTAKYKKIILVSDFQLNDWTFSQIPQIDKSIQLEFIKPFDEFPNNASISVEKIRKLKNGELIQAQTIVENHHSSTKELTIKFTSGRKSVEEKFSLAPLEKKRLVLSLENPDSNIASILISPDEFPFDDTFHIWLGDQAPINVAIPEANEGKSLDYIFVQKALEEIKGTDASFRVIPLQADLFRGSDLDEAQVLILNDAAAKIPGEELESIKKFIENGGLMIVAPSEKVGLILSRLKAYSIADLTYEKTETLKTPSSLPFKFSIIDPQAELLKIFTSTPDSDLQTFAIYQYNKLQIGGNAHSILEIEQGIPGISLINLGKGNIVVSAIPLNHTWSDFTLSNSFLPLLRNTIVKLAGGDNDKAILKLKTGEKKPTPGEFNALNNSFINTSQPGCQTINNVPIIVNNSRLESMTNTLSIIDFKNSLTPSSGNKVTVIGAPKSGTEYWHLFILLALAAIFGEFALADLWRKQKA